MEIEFLIGLKDQGGNWTNILTMFVAVLNLGFLVYTYRKEKKEQTKQSVLKRKEFWFRTIVVDRSICQLENFNNDFCRELVLIETRLNEKDSKIENVKKEGLRRIKNIFNDMKNSVGPNLKAIDDTLYQKISFFFEEFEDNISDQLETIKLPDDIARLKKFSETMKTKILSTLHRYEENGYKC